MQTSKHSIVLIGAGNVGHQMGLRMHEVGIPVQQVFSRKKRKAQRLAKLIGSSASNQLSAIDTRAQLYILAVKDDAISIVAQQLQSILSQDKLIVHTSGATPKSVLKGYFKNYGVFYPLQTFSVDRKVDFTRLPICIDANRKGKRAYLTTLGKALGSAVYAIDDAQRAALHVSAVFVNNFTNYLYQISASICQTEEIPFDLLRPLLLETAQKIQAHDPKAMQTGPAIRNDQQSIQRHLNYLEQFPEFRELYAIFTRQIQQQSKH